MKASLHIAQDAAADEVLSTDAFALLVGMLLDQQFPMERAFAGPAKILERFGTLDPAAIADADPEAFATLCATPPAIHRYGRSMAGRVQEVARVVVVDYDGDAERLWTQASSGADLLARIRKLPGFGEQKAKIFTALVAKQLGVRPDGWEQAATPNPAPTGAWPTWWTRTRSTRCGRSRRSRRRPPPADAGHPRAAGLRDVRPDRTRGGGRPAHLGARSLEPRGRGSPRPWGEGPRRLDLRRLQPPVPAQHRGQARLRLVVTR
jgi:uncharacterized HhH-GPD family protein